MAPSKLPPLPSIRDIIRMYNLTAMKNMSQNFLLDPKLCNKIVKTAGDLKLCEVCEVGPGPGGITRAILERGCKKLLLIEKDRRFLPVLDHIKDCSQETPVQIVHGDILTFPLSQRFSKESKVDWDDPPHRCPVRLIGNLPFNISNPLLVKFLRNMSSKSDLFEYGRVSLVLTFQKEVAERIVADPFDDQRCRLSAICQIYADCTWAFTISGQAFMPSPKVDVGVVKIRPKKVPLLPDVSFDVVEKFLRVIFNQRQKFCSNSLGGLFPKRLRETLVDQILQMTRIDRTLCSYQLSNEQMVLLIQAYVDLCDRNPGLFEFDHRQPQKHVELQALSC